MPRTRQVDPLGSLCTSALAKYFHQSFKDLTSRKNSSSVRPPIRLRLQRARHHFQSLLDCLPSALQLDLFDKVKEMAKREGGKAVILEEEYYKLLSVFINEKTRHLSLSSPCLFQDSSMALESFLSPLALSSSSASMQEMSIARAVTDLACFEFAPILDKVAQMKNLTSLTIQGLSQADLEEDEMRDFVSGIARNCVELQALDLTDSSFDNRCCDEIAALARTLKILKLDHCPRVETAGAATVLGRMRKLVQFDCDDKLQTLAAFGENDFSDVKLRHASFRHLRGLKKVARAWPCLRDLRVVYRAYEDPVGAPARLDEAIEQLTEFHQDARADLEIQGMSNLLSSNHLDSLSFSGGGGTRIRRLCLSQGEFLHAQALNPWAKHCPNLRFLEVVNCGVVSDEMFVGEIPPLVEGALKDLEELHYEGALPFSLASFLLGSCGRKLTKLTLGVFNGGKGRFPSRILSLLSSGRMGRLREIRLSLEDGVESDFAQILHKAIEDCPELRRLELLLRVQQQQQDSDCQVEWLQQDLRDIESATRRNNWDLEFLYQIRRGRKRVS